jgi:hypothetical protein
MALRNASVGAQLLRSSAGICIAVAFGLGASHWYVRPSVVGLPRESLWTEWDFLCSLASSSVALSVGFMSARAATGAGATAAGSWVARVVIWAALTLFFVLLWVDSVFLFTLLIAPTHAFACLRWVGLWSRWRSERVWRRAR